MIAQDKPSGGNHAAPEKIEPTPAIHLAFQTLQPIGVTFCTPVAVGQRECGAHRRIVILQTIRKFQGALSNDIWLIFSENLGHVWRFQRGAGLV